MPDLVQGTNVRSLLSDDLWMANPPKSMASALVGSPSWTPYVTTLGGDRLTVRTNRPLPAWLRNVLAELDDLSRLPPNWDSRGAVVPSPAAIRGAIDLLALIMRDDTPPPTIVPTARGTLQLEWHRRGMDVEIEIVGRDHAVALVARGDDQDGSEFVVTSDYSHLVDVIDQIT